MVDKLVQEKWDAVEKQIKKFCAGKDWVSFTLNSRTVAALSWIHQRFGKSSLIVDHPVGTNKELYLTRKDGMLLRTQFKELFGPTAKDPVRFKNE